MNGSELNGYIDVQTAEYLSSKVENNVIIQIFDRYINCFVIKFNRNFVAFIQFVELSYVQYTYCVGEILQFCPILSQKFLPNITCAIWQFINK